MFWKNRSPNDRASLQRARHSVSQMAKICVFTGIFDYMPTVYLAYHSVNI